MKRVDRLSLTMAMVAIVAVALAHPAPAVAQWNDYARDAQHSAQSTVASQPLNQILWSTPVDLDPQFADGDLHIHYGSPLVTAANTVIVPVKTGAAGGFEVQAINAATGVPIWTLTTDYILPAHDWTPVFGPALTSKPRLYFPGAGGTVYYRDQPDSSCSTCEGQLAFYGLATYQANPTLYNANVEINTPITADSSGNIYFGFVVTATTPAAKIGRPARTLPIPIGRSPGSGSTHLISGIARISASGKGTWVSVVTAAKDPTMTEVAQNCAPALSTDSSMLYVAVSNTKAGYLVVLDSATLTPVNRVRLKDPKSGLDATLSDDSSASPTVGPDGQVYYGVLENPIGENHYRGWLLHFNGHLSESKTPAAFGWDTTDSIVPKAVVPSYTGSSTYLLMTKYNDYIQAGGTGLNRIALLDPSGSEIDPVTGYTVMNEVRSILGPTPDPAGGVKEWCINSAAVDPLTSSIIAGSEDGNLYRWDPQANVFSESIVLTPGIGEAYTPTVIGVDGTDYAINDATLFAVGN
jgi:hypothetical protein